MEIKSGMTFVCAVCLLIAAALSVKTNDDWLLYAMLGSIHLVTFITDNIKDSDV